MPPQPSARRRASASIPTVAAAIGLLWLAGMVAGDRFGLFAERWIMSVTMAFGSFIAGATSEGGGAVAFPVMTLALGIPPAVARDFSLMIQTVGMGAATATILWVRIPVERRALVFASLGGAVGVIVGLELVAPRLAPAFAKMTFLATWLAFAAALYWINRYRERETLARIEAFGAGHALALAATGVLGGVVSGIAGSGLDILTFSLLVLRFRIDERVATPTSVVLMAVNATVGFAWKSGAGGGMEPLAWEYWWVCVPIVVVGAPLGARFIADRSRLFVAGILYASIGVQFVAGLVVVPQTPTLVAYWASVFVAGLGVFWRMSAGVRRDGREAAARAEPAPLGAP